MLPGPFQILGEQYHRNEYCFHKTLRQAKSFIKIDSLCKGGDGVGRASSPSTEQKGRVAFTTKGEFVSGSLIISGNHPTLLWSAVGGSRVAIMKRECFCEGKEMPENFLQESTGTDKGKMYSWASCLVATRYSRECNRDKVTPVSLFPLPPLRLSPPGPLFFSLQGLFCLKPFPGPYPKWL